MKNEQIPYRWIILGVAFILWGLANGFFNKPGDVLGYAVTDPFSLLGALIIVYSVYEIFKYKRTGKIKIRTDERRELNILKASRIGFLFIMLTLGALVMSEHAPGANLMGLIITAWFVTVLVFTAAFFSYEVVGEK